VVLILACLAFLLGSFPSGLVLAYLTTGRDVRRHGSGNIGASNAGDAAGLPVGIAVGTLDVAKGVAPMLLARWLGFDATGLAVIALAAVLGHDFSIFLRFRGGKGVATSLGVALVLAPVAALLALMTWLVVLFVTRYTAVASLVALASAPIIFALTGRPAPYVWLGIALFLLTAGKHWENIVRLIRGREKKMGT
jgi:glycerol-3-phosphate acyltransferase PlsY